VPVDCKRLPLFSIRAGQNWRSVCQNMQLDSRTCRSSQIAVTMWGGRFWTISALCWF